MKGVTIVVIVVLVVIVVSYGITIYELYKNQSWIFAPWEPDVPDNACLPLISFRQLTPDEKETRDAAINAVLNPSS